MMLRTVVSVALLSAVVLAWGEEGHRAIAAIAAELLNSEANSALGQWNLETGVDGDFTLVSVSTQPDAYRHEHGGGWSESLHFLNMGDNETHVVESRDCPPSIPCVISAIQNYTTLVTKGPSAAPWNWTMEPSPVSFVVHLTGDCHQPLHVAFTGDRGGLYQDVKFFVSEFVPDLHTAWDRGMVEYYQDDWYDLAQDLLSVIRSNSSIVDIYSANMNPADWANESFQRVRSWVYNVSPGDRGHIPADWGNSGSDREYLLHKVRLMTKALLEDGQVLNADGLPLVEESKWAWERDATFHEVTERFYNQSSLVIGKNYYYRQMPVIMERLMAAGIRLATLLNKALPAGTQ